MNALTLALFLFLFSLLLPKTVSCEPVIQQAVIQEKYAGGFKDDYFQELSRVRTFLSLAEQSISTQLGLIQYGQGFYHPVIIRFDDGAPAINENPFFYVQTHQDTTEGETSFRQELVVNVEAFAHKRKASTWRDPDLRNGFYYAMTQLILNDIAEGQPEKILPIWVQEGLAVYVSGSGDTFVTDAGGRVRRSGVTSLVGELNRPYPYLSNRQWARYYLAIKYIYDTGGINALQGFVREMIQGTSAADAVRHTLSQEWPDFQQNVKAFTTKAFTNVALNDDDPRALSPDSDTLKEHTDDGVGVR